MKFQNKLKSIREKLGYTGMDLAEKMGVSQSQLWKVENGYQRGSADFRKKVTNFLGLKIEEIFNEEKEDNGQNTAC